MEGVKGKVCVTGGTGYVASWLIMRLLQHGYSVNTTIRSDPEKKKDISYLTDLPGASERLQIFNADLDRPESFTAPIEGCIGVFHLAHTMDFQDKEDEETHCKRSINATLGILQACVDSKTVKKVVYTSSVAAVMFSGKPSSAYDETLWTDVDFVRSLRIPGGGSYYVTKTLTEKAALEFAETNGLDLVTIIPPFIHGPFITPHCPASVRISMSMIFGDPNQFQSSVPLVHVDDAASAYIFLFECPTTKGRYICSAVDIGTNDLFKLLSEKYPEYKIPSQCFPTQDTNFLSFSSKKLLETGFKYKYGVEDMYDEALQCCNQKSLL